MGQRRKIVPRPSSTTTRSDDEDHLILQAGNHHHQNISTSLLSNDDDDNVHVDVEKPVPSLATTFPLTANNASKAVVFMFRRSCRQCWRLLSSSSSSSLSSWIVRIVIGLMVVDYFIWFIRCVTYSRPSWIYGSPLDAVNVAQCLVNNSQVAPTTTSSSSSVYWEWHNFSKESPLSSHNKRRQNKSKHRLLIAQYTGYGKYTEMMDMVAPVNVQYAAMWGHDIVLLQGTALEFPGISSHCNNEPRSTFNKIPLLKVAYEHRSDYDYVLILDTDAMMVDMEYDITTLLPSSHLLAAHRVLSWDWTNTWDINAGITLWNLHHSTMHDVLKTWYHLVLSNPYLVVERNDDQYFLQRTLLELGYWKRAVKSTTKEFNYYEGTVIKHFKRDQRSWSRTSLDQRLLRIQEAIDDMDCTTNNKSEAMLPKNSYDISSSSSSLSSSLSCQYPLSSKFAYRTKQQ